ncbi:NTF2 fold immunity protein [Spongiivirga citrea]|uniref:NTF2 fold immunity protein domain-containing protein n=1 Tax=Spongiivirga citrea TaxID=1481457 RepID=A0A6M0CQZ3_9FLAO|nr:NTF2 fold immunity protein [Spongiivirga citrea]NER17937.1 hypothetical protein [Spongiivirga citrea]
MLNKVMFKKIALIVVFIFSISSYSQNLDSPKEIVVEFIKDYYEWNQAAIKMNKENQNTEKIISKAKKDYSRNILLKYCFKGFKGQPISFGDDSAHNPKKEIIISEDISKNEATVLTRITKMHDFIIEYEYRLVKKKKKWYLVAVDYIDGKKKWPGL